MMARALQTGSRPRTKTHVVAFAAAALALALEMATHLIDFGVYDLRIGVLNSRYEWSYSHVVATLAYVAGAALCTSAAVRGGPRRAAWATAGGLFACLVVDNLLRLHVHVGAWPVLYAPVLLGLSVALIAVARDTPMAPLVYVGLGLLLCSAGIHVVGPTVVERLGWGPNGWGYEVKVALKEGTELAGWVLLVPALARLTRNES
jgi:hypothetical protein